MKMWLKIAVLLVGCFVFSGQLFAQDHTHPSRPELERESPIPLDPSAGKEIGYVYEAFLSPQQEGEEETNIPPFIPAEFLSTAPPVPRNERPSQGHAIIEFTRDYSKAYVYLAVANVEIDTINMLHLHCGRPGQLGPIIVDFGLMGDVHEYLADGVMAIEVTNEDLVAAANHGQGLIGAFTAGCPIIPAIPTDRIRTIAGLAMVARQSELYFNLHTTSQTFYGDIRGEFYPIDINE